MSVWLMPAPEYFQAYFFQCDDENGLSAIIDALRPLRLNGTIRSVVHVGNDYKVLSAGQQYPWTETGGRTPLTPDVMKTLRRKLSIGCWGEWAVFTGRARRSGRPEDSYAPRCAARSSGSSLWTTADCASCVVLRDLSPF